MSKVKAKKIVRKYAEKLKQENFSFYAIYIFGSHLSGQANKWSDIDVAVVSDNLKKDTNKNRLLLWKLRRDVDTRIEPHGFTLKDFKDDANIMAYEVRNTGERVV